MFLLLGAGRRFGLSSRAVSAFADISPRLQPSTAPSALRSAGRLPPARITVINSCASGWHRRQQIVTMVNFGAEDRNNSRDKSNPPTGDGSPTGRAWGRGLRSYAALRLRPTATSANNRVIPRRGTGARQGERGGVVCGLTLRSACVRQPLAQTTG